MVTALGAPPDRPCGDCGHRAHWRWRPDGAWECGRCARLSAPALDDHGLPQIMRHECSKMGCDLAGDDLAGEAPAAPFETAATVMACAGCGAV